MKSLENVTGLQEMNLEEMNEINGGWNWRGAALGVIATWEFGPGAAVIGGIAGGFLMN